MGSFEQAYITMQEGETTEGDVQLNEAKGVSGADKIQLRNFLIAELKDNDWGDSFVNVLERYASESSAEKYGDEMEAANKYLNKLGKQMLKAIK